MAAEGYEHDHDEIPAWDQAFEKEGGLALALKQVSGDHAYHLVRAWFRAGYEAGVASLTPEPSEQLTEGA